MQNFKSNSCNMKTFFYILHFFLYILICYGIILAVVY